MLSESGIYVGQLRHRRFTPVRHEFVYPLFMVFLDVDRIPDLMSVSRLSSYNRWNWMSYDERDHFGNPRLPLRRRLAEDAAVHGVTLPEGRIFLLTHLRYCGYNFNPVSFFYCCGRDGKLETIVAEVNNTFGETCNYWLTLPGRGASGTSSHGFEKALHVSPFMELDCDYRFSFNDPAQRISVYAEVFRSGCSMFDATLSLSRLEWTARNVNRTLARFPLVTMKVMAAIHWEALRLFMKKVPVVRHPGPGLFRRTNPKYSWPEEVR
jgi:DUF1365 family protein